MSFADEIELVAGVDTHRDTHTAALCDARGRVVAQLQVPATPAGYEQVLTWAQVTAGDRQVMWAIEGTRHYGLGLARHLADQGQRNPARGQAQGRQERPDRCHPRRPGTAGPSPACPDAR